MSMVTLKFGEEQYLVWSRTLNCPITSIMSRLQAIQLAGHDTDVVIADSNPGGVSQDGLTIAEVIRDNVAGQLCETLTPEQIVAEYTVGARYETTH